MNLIIKSTQIIVLLFLFISPSFSNNVIDIFPNYGKQNDSINITITMANHINIDGEINIWLKRPQKKNFMRLFSNNATDSILASVEFIDSLNLKASFLIPENVETERWDLFIKIGENDMLNESFYIYKDNFKKSFYILCIIIGASFGFLLFINIKRFNIFPKILFDIAYCVILYFTFIKTVITNYPPPPVWNYYIAGICFVLGCILGYWQFNSLTRRKY